MAAIHVMMLLLGLTAWHMESVAGVCCGKTYFHYDSDCIGPYPRRATTTMTTCYKIWDKCADCTNFTPYCGVGRCNIFGCNCDDGCRTGNGICYCYERECYMHDPRLQKTSPNGTEVVSTVQAAEEGVTTVPAVDEAVTTPPSFQAADIIGKADGDHDGRLSYEEARQYLPGYYSDEELQALDLNSDGFFTAEEIDPGQ